MANDALTGLPDRQEVRSHLDAELKLSPTRTPQVALLLLDLDQFDDVNEAFGYTAGDALLRAVGQRLRTHVPGSAALVARIGGDGFAVVARTGRRGAERLARAIVLLLERPFVIDTHPVVASASIGIALSGEHGSDSDTLIRRATTAMQTAKRGHAAYAMYASAHEAHRARFLLVNELGRAIDQDQLFLDYQPQVRLSDGEIVAVEALVRWRHPTRGILGPAEFVPLAERGRLSGELLRWVVGSALRRARAWADDGWPIRVAVNLAPPDLRDPRFVPDLARALDRAGVPAGRLAVEVTESTLIADPERAVRALSRIRDLGVSVVIDDFGTGYSSLSYLHRLPTTGLKIDRSFLSSVEEERGMAILRTIVGLGRELGLAVVAEGVERASDLRALRVAGCETAQGYWLGRPMPAAAIDERRTMGARFVTSLPLWSPAVAAAAAG